MNNTQKFVLYTALLAFVFTLFFIPTESRYAGTFYSAYRTFWELNNPYENVNLRMLGSFWLMILVPTLLLYRLCR